MLESGVTMLAKGDEIVWAVLISGSDGDLEMRAGKLSY